MTPTDPVNDPVRVLAVDDNETELGVLQANLNVLGYEVTTCRSHNEAISLFHEDGQQFCVVIANIDWQSGFELVGLVGRKRGIPMIVTCSVEDNNKLIGRAINNGALLGLEKLQLMDHLWLIWQLALGHRGRSAIINNELPSGGAEDQSSRSEGGSRGGERRESGVINLKMTSRLVWTDELKRKFVEAFDSLEENEVTPKKIQELMNVPSLKRENISSRLQKYRLARKKAKKSPKGKDSKASVAKHSNKNRGVAINEPVSLNVQHNAAHLTLYSMLRDFPFQNVSGSDFQTSFGNTCLQPQFQGTESNAGGVLRRIMSSVPFAQLSTFHGLPDNAFTTNMGSFQPPVMNGGIVPPNWVLDHGRPIEQPTQGFEEPLRHGHHGVQRLGSEDMFGASLEAWQSYQGDLNMQSNAIDGPAGEGDPNIDPTSKT